jgi:hypothetical protein
MVNTLALFSFLTLFIDSINRVQLTNLTLPRQLTEKGYITSYSGIA